MVDGLRIGFERFGLENQQVGARFAGLIHGGPIHVQLNGIEGFADNQLTAPGMQNILSPGPALGGRSGKGVKFGLVRPRMSQDTCFVQELQIGFDPRFPIDKVLRHGFFCGCGCSSLGHGLGPCRRVVLGRTSLGATLFLSFSLLSFLRSLSLIVLSLNVIAILRFDAVHGIPQQDNPFRPGRNAQNGSRHAIAPGQQVGSIVNDNFVVAILVVGETILIALFQLLLIHVSIEALGNALGRLNQASIKVMGFDKATGRGDVCMFRQVHGQGLGSPLHDPQ